MKKYRVMFYAGAAISLLVGLWHFTVPWMFGWASYIPYETLVVPINYVSVVEKEYIVERNRCKTLFMRSMERDECLRSFIRNQWMHFILRYILRQ